jgi:hypothetical protein
MGRLMYSLCFIESIEIDSLRSPRNCCAIPRDDKKKCRAQPPMGKQIDRVDQIKKLSAFSFDSFFPRPPVIRLQSNERDCFASTSQSKKTAPPERFERSTY